MADAPLRLPAIRTALFVPADRPRAVARARTLPVDLVILDLEDAVIVGRKEAARADLAGYLDEGWGDRLVAVRVNAGASGHAAADRAAVAGLPLDFVVVPKVERVDEVAGFTPPVLAMIESAAGVLAAAGIARAPGVAGLLAGTNDLAADLRLPRDPARDGLRHALGQIVLAARAAGVVALDGVFNRLDDPAGLAAECRQGRAWGFDGKTLIHPDQVAPAAAAFAPDEAELEDARAMVAAATGGAARFRGRMVEAMHVAAARRLLAAADGGKEEGASL